MKHQGYLNRALKAKDRRYARVFEHLGYDVAALSTDAAAPPVDVEDLGELRSAYAMAFGRKPYGGWDAAELKRRLAERREI